MVGLLIRWIVNTVSLIVVVRLVPGIHVDRWEGAATAALVLGLLNAFLKPFVVLLTLPLQIISLGFFTLLINGVMLYLVSKIVEGFYIASFWSAFWGALIFSAISFLLNLFIEPGEKMNVRFYRKGRVYSSHDDVVDVEGKSKDDEEPPRKIR